MAVANNKCANIIKSIGWCEGTPEPSGLRRRGYYISAQDVVKCPRVKKADNGRPETCVIAEDFVLAADATFKYLEFLPEKSTMNSTSQGEYPSITQLNNATLVLPGVGPEESDLACYVNNNRCFFLLQDAKGRWRLFGNPDFPMNNTVAQDNGQGATGSTSTTLTIAHTDLTLPPFYQGKIMTEDGAIPAEDA